MSRGMVAPPSSFCEHAQMVRDVDLKPKGGYSETLGLCMGLLKNFELRFIAFLHTHDNEYQMNHDIYR